MKYVFLLIVCLITTSINAQIQTNYNLGFETVSGGNLPLGWQKMGNCNAGLDAKVKSEGRYSMVISSCEGNGANFSGLTLRIPHHFEGAVMELSGLIKTADVTGGFAGLMVRVDPDVSFDNMAEQAVQGTRDWMRYTAKVNLEPESTTAIYIGIMLVGKGTAWFDDLRLTIDGIDYQDALKEAFPAIADTAYQHRSQIQNVESSAEVRKRLKDLAQVWGFLKYNHPNVAKGLFNMDAELFRLIPAVIAPHEKDINPDVAISSFIGKLGDVVEVSESLATNLPFKMEPDYSWIKDLDYSVEIKATLASLSKKKYALPSHYYVSTNKIGVPTFNEQDYPFASIDDLGFRLLAVFRFWNIVQYYSPYRYLIQDTWHQILEDSIHDMIDAKDEMDVSKALLRLFAGTEDSHATIFQNKISLQDFYGRRSVPATIGFIEQKPVVLSLSGDHGASNGLQIGDVIKSINDTLIEDRVSELRAYTAASNEDGLRRNIAKQLLFHHDSVMKIGLERNGKDTIVLADTYLVGMSVTQPIKQDSAFSLLPNKIGYINHGVITRSDLPRLWREIQDCEGLIIDMRNYPKDFLVFDIAGYLVSETTSFAKLTRSDIDKGGFFWFTPDVMVGGKSQEVFNGLVVILVNEHTQSSAEYHAMAYQQAPKSWTIGSTTAGADGNVALVPLPFDYKVFMTSLGVYYPDGGETQQVGIRIDQEVRPTRSGIQTGRDELLEQAIAHINKACADGY